MSLLLPRNIDIILGKGAIAKYHPGNIFLRNQLEPMKIPYQKLQTNAKKNAVVQLILEAIIESGRRFYMEDEESPDKFRVVGLDERLRDGKLRLAKRIRKLLNASAATKYQQQQQQQQKELMNLRHQHQPVHCNPYDESTAFSLSQRSAHDESTATLPYHRPVAASFTDQDQSRDPPSVIFCQVIDDVEV